MNKMQLDQIEKQLNSLLSMATQHIERLNRIEKQLGFLPKPEPWIPKKGEMVFVKSCVGIEDSPGVGCLISVEPSVNQYCVNNTRNGQCTVTLDQLRPATPIEINAHMEAEWAKVSELQEYDSCKCSLDDIKYFVNMAKNANIELVHHEDVFFQSNMIGVYWYPGGKLCAMSFTDDEQNYPFSEFKRRLQGTIAEAKKKKEWAFIDELQDGDYTKVTDAVKNIAKQLPIAGPCSLSVDLCVWTYDKPNDFKIWGGSGFTHTPKNELPENEWIRRAKGTASRLEAEAKRKEAERKVEFGTRVKYQNRDYRVVSEGPDTLGYYVLISRTHLYTVTAQRSEFTIIQENG